MSPTPVTSLLSIRLRGLVLLASLSLQAPFAHATQPIPAFAEVRAGATPSVAVLLARDGTPLAERRLDFQVRRLEWVGLHSLSPSLKEALLAAEDKRFFEHSGVDWRAFAGSLWHNLWNDRKRGASTLSMQLAGLLDPELALGRGGQPRRSLGQKWDQALAAQALEARWTKEQILEAYLNLAPFRGDLQGVHASARALFGKSPTELNRPEALILAVLLRGPNAKPEVVAHRACVLAEHIGAPAACAPAQRLAQNNLDRQNLQPRWDLAPHLARQLLHAPGERIATTLDADTQKLVLAALRRTGASDAAALVLDNASGDVLAYVGALDGASLDMAATSRNSSGLITPLIYAVALERRVITAASLVDESLSNHAPTVPEERMWVSVRRALADAMPEPAQTVQRMVADGVAERLRLIDVEPPRSGLPDLNLIQVASLYRSLASGGAWQEPRIVGNAERPVPRRLMRAEASFIVSDIMTREDETGSPQAFVQRVFSADGKDAQAVGYTERHTVAVWAPLGRGVTPLASAAWQDILRGLQRGQPAPRPPTPPPGVVSSLIAFDPPVEAARREWFLRGTEADRIAVPRITPHISYPGNGILVDGMAIAEDAGFRIRFEASQAALGIWWRLDGERFGNGNGGGRAGWRPVAGRHVLELMAPDGQILDAVTFAVRAPLDGESKPADQQPEH